MQNDRKGIVPELKCPGFRQYLHPGEVVSLHLLLPSLHLDLPGNLHQLLRVLYNRQVQDRNSVKKVARFEQSAR